MNADSIALHFISDDRKRMWWIWWKREDTIPSAVPSSRIFAKASCLWTAADDSIWSNSKGYSTVNRRHLSHLNSI